ncbi:hypothetical protein M6B38_113760 [Iris pallida]|uniref:Uncharacterized protein n=1 Tax=Iris pallida TaxID=29817 RepID=A0AAX6ILM6_IRIPA|nr:hypothetical protein M6B38_113760 [Iris pallida]
MYMCLKLEWLGCRLAVAFCVRVVRCRQRCVRVWVIVLYVRVQMVVSSLDFLMLGTFLLIGGN